MRNQFIIIAGISGATAVMLGAMGAHALKDVLGVEQLRVYEKAVQYQMYHTFALLFTGILFKYNTAMYLKWAGNLFIAGIILFSGSLYFLALRSLTGLESMGWIGAITPFGGLSFIAGWLFVSISFFNKKT